MLFGIQYRLCQSIIQLRLHIPATQYSKNYIIQHDNKIHNTLQYNIVQFTLQTVLQYNNTVHSLLNMDTNELYGTYYNVQYGSLVCTMANIQGSLVYYYILGGVFIEALAPATCIVSIYLLSSFNTSNIIHCLQSFQQYPQV